MIIMKRKNIVLGMLTVSVFVLVVSIVSLYVQIQISSGTTCGCAIPIPLFIPLIACIGLFIGTLFYYLIFPNFDKPKIDKDVFLNFLSGDERSVFEKILEKKTITQASLVKETELSKVKVFRILEHLKHKGLITKIPYGKTNVIELNDELTKFL